MHAIQLVITIVIELLFDPQVVTNPIIGVCKRSYNLSFPIFEDGSGRLELARAIASRTRPSLFEVSKGLSAFARASPALAGARLQDEFPALPSPRAP